MRNSRLIGPRPGSTPASLRTSTPGRRHELPDDLLREASLRLGIMSLLGAVLWTVGTTLGHLSLRAMNPGDPQWRQLSSVDAIAAGSVVVSLGLFFYTRHTRRDPRFVLDLGLAYLIAMALALGLMIHTGQVYGMIGNTVPPNAVQPTISWIGAVVLITAAIVPSQPWKMAVAGLVAASMNPVAMLIVRAENRWDFGPTSNALWMHYPDFILVGVAVLISRVVTTLGHQVTRARELGSYHLGELLGRGGMGEVYLATHRMLARPAAIKLIRPEILGGGGGESAQLAVRRFRREAEAAAKLRSPHTVEIYDFGVREDDTLYYVMELLEGMDLETLVRDYGPLPAPRVVRVLRQACESLEEAHAVGLVHRDIKPANIHLGRVGLRHDFVKVLDFGLVKAAANAGDRDARSSIGGAGHSLATEAGLTPGTPAYMAPEMALGDAVDGRADLYALGCVAYYLLTGRLVFEAETPFQVIARHLQNEPVPPSRRTDRFVPAGLDRLVLKCLAKSPADRPQTAGELERALAAIDTEPWTEEQAARWWAVATRPAIAAADPVLAAPTLTTALQPEHR